MKTKRAALYLRVSTDSQTTENQRLDLEKLASLRGWSVAKVYEDAGISGAKGKEQRPGLHALMQDAKRRRFDVAVFWSVDRLGRSTATVTGLMKEFAECGVEQFYWKESMDTATAHGRAMLEMAAVFANLEREMIRERVRAGIARMQETGKTKSGKPTGRPRVASKKEEKVRAALASGLGIKSAARAAGVGVSVAQRVKASMQQQAA